MGTGRGGDGDSVVMQVGEPVTRGRDGADGTGGPMGAGGTVPAVRLDASPATGPARRLLVAAIGVLVAMLAAAAVVLWPDADARVLVTSPLLDEPAAAPPAPQRAPAIAWTATLPGHLALRDLAVQDDLVLGLGGGLPGAAAEQQVVAWDRATGDVRWTASVTTDGLAPDVLGAEDAGAMFHVVGPDRVTTLSPAGVLPGAAPEVTVDASDGRILARRDPVPVSTSSRIVHPELEASVTSIRRMDHVAQSLPIRTVARVHLDVEHEVVDLRTGDVLFTLAGTLRPRAGGWVARTEDGLQLLERDGTVVATMPDGITVAALDDVVIAAQPDPDGSIRLVGWGDDGAARWTLPWSEPADDADTEACSMPVGHVVGTQSVLVEVPTGRHCAYRLPLRLRADGTVSPLDRTVMDELVVDRRAALVSGLGDPFVLCGGGPVRRQVDDGLEGCPYGLAALHLDGARRAIAQDVAVTNWVQPATARPGMVTTIGLLLNEQRGLVLRGWSDLEPLWTLSGAGLPSNRSVLVATSGDGVAFAHRGESDAAATITWAEP